MLKIDITHLKGNLIDIHKREIYPAEIIIEGGIIKHINRTNEHYKNHILPGFVDAHIHIESSMLVPYEFARVALKHGTIATISDPHEIANVLGVDGVHYMIENARDAHLKFHFGAPSCVPATQFENAGATINSEDIAVLMDSDDIYYLSEMMNYPGVLFKDEEVMKKLEIAKASGKPIDGHAPGLRGQQAKQYIEAGISTDHECFSLEEALDKLSFGMKIIIREGSAAKNYNALHSLIKSYPSEIMFCSDDKHPDDLLLGHINLLVKRSLELGYDLFDVLNIACKHPVEHYNMNVGLLRVGDPADMIVIDNPVDFNVSMTIVDGIMLADNGRSFLKDKSHPKPNNFKINKLIPEAFQINKSAGKYPIIRAIDGELITEKEYEFIDEEHSCLLPDSEKDLLKISVVNRYKDTAVTSWFIRGFGIKQGAFASTVAHDSHNIIVVGTDDDSMCQAVNLLVENSGGLSAVNQKEEKIIGLPVAGLMSDLPCEVIGKQYAEIDGFVKDMGCQLKAPFMTLSFMALLVIPKIKMSDLGLFDAEKFEFIK